MWKKPGGAKGPPNSGLLAVSQRTDPCLTSVAASQELPTAVVIVELAMITWVRHRYMETPPIPAAIQVFVGGALVFVTGLLIGSS